MKIFLYGMVAVHAREMDTLSFPRAYGIGSARYRVFRILNSYFRKLRNRILNPLKWETEIAVLFPQKTYEVILSLYLLALNIFFISYIILNITIRLGSFSIVLYTLVALAAYSSAHVCLYNRPDDAWYNFYHFTWLFHKNIENL